MYSVSSVMNAKVLWRVCNFYWDPHYPITILFDMSEFNGITIAHIDIHSLYHKLEEIIHILTILIYCAWVRNGLTALSQMLPSY